MHFFIFKTRAAAMRCSRIAKSHRIARNLEEKHRIANLIATSQIASQTTLKLH